MDCCISWKVSKAFIWNVIYSTGLFFSLGEFIRSYSVMGIVVHGFRQSLNTGIHSPFMVFLRHVMWWEIIFQTAVMLAFSYERNLRSEGL